MIKVQEGKQVGIIYHYTSVESLLKILETNQLKAYDYDPKSGKRFMSFTRDKNFERSEGRQISSMEVRIALDGSKISERYRLEPHNYFAGIMGKSHKDLESEERLVMNRLEGVRSYIVKIDILIPYIDTSNDEHLFVEILHLMTTPSMTPELKSALEADNYGPRWIDMKKIAGYIEDRFEIKCEVRPRA